MFQSLCRNFFYGLIFTFLGLCSLYPLASFALDIAAPAAEGLQNLVGEACPPYNAEKVLQRLHQIRCSDSSINSSLQKSTLQIAELRSAVNSSAEDQYFAELALQHSQELLCGASFAQEVATGTANAPDQLALKFEKLKLIRIALQDASNHVRLDPNISLKACPLNESDLNHDFPEELRKQDPSYAACLDIIATREAYKQSLAEIPLNETPALKKLIKDYQNMKLDPSPQELEKLIRKAYRKSEEDLKEQALQLKNRATTKGGQDFNREEKRSLISNPLVNKKVLKASNEDSDFKALVCSADARYGKGADRLDEALFFGTFAISGSSLLVAKVGTKAIQLMHSAQAAKNIGSLQLAMRVAAYSTTAASASNEIYRTCAPQANTLQVKKTGATCVSAPTITQLKEDSCIFSASIHAMSFGTAAMATRISRITVEAQKSTLASQKKAVVTAKAERKIWEDQAARQNEIVTNKAHGIPTLRWQSQKSPHELPAVKGHMPKDKSGLRFDQRRSIKESAKKKEAEIATLRKEATERQRLEDFYEQQGLEGHDLTKAVRRHIEVDILKAEGKIIDAVPANLKLEPDSFIRGGRSPFQSKVGDIHLLTADQLEALPDGVRVFNFKTGKEFIKGIDDLDAAELGRKVGGKYIEYGFKVSP